MKRLSPPMGRIATKGKRPRPSQPSRGPLVESVRASKPCSVFYNCFSMTVPSIFYGVPPPSYNCSQGGFSLYFTADRDRTLDLPRPPCHLVTSELMLMSRAAAFANMRLTFPATRLKSPSLFLACRSERGVWFARCTARRCAST